METYYVLTAAGYDYIDKDNRSKNAQILLILQALLLDKIYPTMDAIRKRIKSDLRWRRQHIRRMVGQVKMYWKAATEELKDTLGNLEFVLLDTVSCGLAEKTYIEPKFPEEAEKPRTDWDSPALSHDWSAEANAWERHTN